MGKRLSALLLAASLLIACAETAFAAAVGGVSSAWSQAYLYDAANVYRILPNGLTGGDYRQAITREAFCRLAYETVAYMAGDVQYYKALREANEKETYLDGSAGLQRIYPAVPSTASPFTDTNEKSILALHSIGIIRGKEADKFAPNDLLTREEAAPILARIADYFSLRHFDNAVVFTDADTISDWAEDDVNTVCGMGIMNGLPNGTFSPDTVYTEEQAVATMIREINAIPFEENCEKIADGIYFVFNSFWLWTEDEHGNVLFKLPMNWATYNYRADYGYSNMDFLQHNGRTIVAAAGRSNDPKSLSYKKSGTTFFDLGTGKELLFLPASSGSFFALTKDHDAIIMQDSRMSAPTADAIYDVYAVYDFTGKEKIAPGNNWKLLYDAGYVDTIDSSHYTWK